MVWHGYCTTVSAFASFIDDLRFESIVYVEHSPYRDSIATTVPYFRLLETR
jgi:hypothetical protein